MTPHHHPGCPSSSSSSFLCDCLTCQLQHLRPPTPPWADNIPTTKTEVLLDREIVQRHRWASSTITCLASRMNHSERHSFRRPNIQKHQSISNRNAVTLSHPVEDDSRAIYGRIDGKEVLEVEGESSGCEGGRDGCRVT